MQVASLRLHKQHKAATKIQALWRGYSNLPWYNWAFTATPWEYWRFDIEDMLVDNHDPININFGPAFSSDNAGDGPTQVPLFLTLSTHNAALMSFRVTNMIETLDIQIWSYTMRLHRHEYVGQFFDHHHHFGSEDIFADFVMLQHLFREWLHDDPIDELYIPRPLWDRCLEHFETFEVAEIFHDDRVTALLQELITDMIRLGSDRNYQLLPRPHTDATDFVPSF